jgi:glutamyl-tRNA reductase
MNLLLMGLNHRTAPVALREQLAFSREGVAAALLLFHQQFPDYEAAIISTCNRVEILVSGKDEAVDAGEIMRFLSQTRDVPVATFRSHLYKIEDRHAIRHMLRVVSGLDSMVIGEAQIVNQLKQAYQLAHEQSTAGPVLHRLFHHAFGVSKRIRTDTAIDEAKTSISSLAVDVIRKALPDLEQRRTLIVGAGEMAQLTAKYLQAAGMRNFAVTTRTFMNARALAEGCGGVAIPFDQLDQQIAEADVVITATSCPTAFLKVQRIQRAQEIRGGRELLLVDLSVPRNIEPETAGIAGVQLFDVDALGKMVTENYRQRLGQVELCEKIVEEEVDAFEKWAAESKVRPLIEQMYQDVRALAEIEVRRFMNRCPDLSEHQQSEVSQLVDRVVGKLMHPCVSAVRQQSMAESAVTLAEAFHTTRLSFNCANATKTSRASLFTE